MLFVPFWALCEKSSPKASRNHSVYRGFATRPRTCDQKSFRTGKQRILEREFASISRDFHPYGPFFGILGSGAIWIQNFAILLVFVPNFGSADLTKRKSRNRANDCFALAKKSFPVPGALFAAGAVILPKNYRSSCKKRPGNS